ncbi:sensor histidine kinase [Actinomadura sp. KC216]|uniref:ATP-binding protein n=1 Tax=Actinomadura sp. KC216 TaxID=2530370 RepID=UPI00104CF15F|nr:ATP-binding protein [Actinomadura sp. KC216]TDB87080.1 sensor histidine kinase [Actinomadura sp. KC216]
MSPRVVAPEVPTTVLPPTERAPAAARRFVTEHLRGWGIADLADALVIVSELVTNALRHGHGQIIVRLLRDERDGRPVIEVWDDGDGRPEVQPEDHTAETGRGLLMVSLLATAWGTRPLLENGKATWAKC